MEYKKYLIFDSYDKMYTYIDVLDRNLKIIGLIGVDQSWDTPKLVGIKNDVVSGRYFINTPHKQWYFHGPEFLISESIDTNPASILENIFKIYDYINDDLKHNYLNSNYLVEPHSLDYKKDVKIRFAQKHTFDDYGNLVLVETERISTLVFKVLLFKYIDFV